MFIIGNVLISLKMFSQCSSYSWNQEIMGVGMVCLDGCVV